MNVIPQLKNDVCRCHDDTCPERHECLRWIERDLASYKWIISSNSLLQYEQDGTTCLNKIKPLDDCHE